MNKTYEKIIKECNKELEILDKFKEYVKSKGYVHRQDIEDLIDEDVKKWTELKNSVKESDEEEHPYGECTACYCERCGRMCLWYDCEADYCVNGPHRLDEEDIKEGCDGFENAW